MASVYWSLGARDDIRQAVEFIGKDSPAYAASLVGRITAAIERLERFPRIGRVVPEYDDDDLREIIVSDYRVVYRMLGEDVAIAAVVHGRRDLARRLGEEPWDMG